MKKMKQTPPEPTAGVETFGGDYQKCESTFQLRIAPAPATDPGRPKRPITAQGKRKHSRAHGR